jgi:UDP-N-acetylglucosamine:LPS N-acetylglucosamine transferase
MKKFLFVCGGTGGHIFPAVAIAESLKKMGVTQITFAGRKDSMEERLVAKNWRTNTFRQYLCIVAHSSRIWLCRST